MLKKIKKWHLVVIVILGIVGYWVSQNMWVFEKQIVVNDYQKFLIGTEWKSKERNSIWTFNDDNEFIEESYLGDVSKGEWEIDNKIIILNEPSFILPSKWKVVRVYFDEIHIRLIEPNVNGNYIVKLLKL